MQLSLIEGLYQEVTSALNFNILIFIMVLSQWPHNTCVVSLRVIANTWQYFICNFRYMCQPLIGRWVRALAWTGDRTVLAGFESHCGKLRFGTLAIPFTPLCQCLSEETLKAVGPFYRVSMPGEVKDPTSPHWNV